jgi:hypothetical protein
MFQLNPRLVALLSVLSVTGCRGDDPGTSETDSGTTTGASSTTDTPTTTPTTTGVDATTSGTTGTPTTSGGEPDTGDNSGNFLTTNTDTGNTGDPGPGPNGAMCSSDADCESMNCVSLLLGMVQFCGECNEDQDCVDAGTGTACTLSIATQAAMCTNGPPGSTCMSDAACMGEQFCENVLDTPILPNTCSDCGESADCDMGKLCSPVIDLMGLTGKKSCVEPGSVQNDQLCPSGADGDMVCNSGHCTETSLMGFISLNICGECAQDSDCPIPGQTCTPAEASMSGLSGSTCTGA